MKKPATHTAATTAKLSKPRFSAKEIVEFFESDGEQFHLTADELAILENLPETRNLNEEQRNLITVQVLNHLRNNNIDICVSDIVDDLMYMLEPKRNIDIDDIIFVHGRNSESWKEFRGMDNSMHFDYADSAQDSLNKIDENLQLECEYQGIDSDELKPDPAAILFRYGLENFHRLSEIIR